VPEIRFANADPFCAGLCQHDELLLYPTQMASKADSIQDLPHYHLFAHPWVYSVMCLVAQMTEDQG
jgi:hypothetical protein